MARQRNIDGIATALGTGRVGETAPGFNLGEKDIISWGVLHTSYGRCMALYHTHISDINLYFFLCAG